MGYFQDKLERLEKAKSKYGDAVDLGMSLLDSDLPDISEPTGSTVKRQNTERYYTGEGNHYQTIDEGTTELERTFGRPDDVWTPLTPHAKVTMPAKELVDKVWSEAGRENQKQNLAVIAELRSNPVKSDWDGGFMAESPTGNKWEDEIATPGGFTNSKARALYAINNTNDYKTMKAIGKNPTSFYGVLNDVSVLKGSHFSDEEVERINDMIEAAQKASDTYWGVYFDKERQSITPYQDLITEDIGGSYSDVVKPIYKYDFSSDIEPVGVEAGGEGYDGEVRGTWNITRAPVNIDDYSRRDKLTTREVYTSKKAYDERVLQIRGVQYNVAKKTGNLDVFFNSVEDIEKLPFISVNDKKLYYQGKINKGSVSVEEAIQNTGGNVNDFKLNYKQKHNYYRNRVVGGFMTPEEASKESGIPVKELDIDSSKKKKKKKFGIF